MERPPPTLEPDDIPTPPSPADVPPPAPAGPVEPYEQKRRAARWWFVVPVALIVYLLLAAITLVQPVRVASASLTVPIPGLSAERMFGLPDRPFTVAIVGLDLRPGGSGAARTDSILILRVDGGRDRAGIVSIPRDALMQVQSSGGFFEERVNTAFVFNFALKPGDCPPDPTSCGSDEEMRAKRVSNAMDALQDTIEHNLGIAIDHYMVFDQRDAAAIIDAAGGVDVTVRQAFGQDNYSDDDINVVPQFFPEGKLHLTGFEAVAYGRIRQGSSDFDRILRQQQVAEGLVEQLSSPFSVRRWFDVWDAYRDGVDTDLTRRQTGGLFVLLKRIGTDRLVTRSLGDASVSCVNCLASIQLLEPNETARIIGEAFGDEALGQQAGQLLVAAGVTP